MAHATAAGEQQQESLSKQQQFVTGFPVPPFFYIEYGPPTAPRELPAAVLSYFKQQQYHHDASGDKQITSARRGRGDLLGEGSYAVAASLRSRCYAEAAEEAAAAGGRGGTGGGEMSVLGGRYASTAVDGDAVRSSNSSNMSSSSSLFLPGEKREEDGQGGGEGGGGGGVGRAPVDQKPSETLRHTATNAAAALTSVTRERGEIRQGGVFGAGCEQQHAKKKEGEEEQRKAAIDPVETPEEEMKRKALLSAWLWGGRPPPPLPTSGYWTSFGMMYAENYREPELDTDTKMYREPGEVEKESDIYTPYYLEQHQNTFQRKRHQPSHPTTLSSSSSSSSSVGAGGGGSGEGGGTVITAAEAPGTKETPSSEDLLNAATFTSSSSFLEGNDIPAVNNTSSSSSLVTGTIASSSSSSSSCSIHGDGRVSADMVIEESTGIVVDLKDEFKRLYRMYVEQTLELLNTLARGAVAEGGSGSPANRWRRIVRLHKNLLHILLRLQQYQAEQEVVQRLEKQLLQRRQATDELRRTMALIKILLEQQATTALVAPSNISADITVPPIIPTPTEQMVLVPKKKETNNVAAHHAERLPLAPQNGHAAGPQAAVTAASPSSSTLGATRVPFLPLMDKIKTEHIREKEKGMVAPADAEDDEKEKRKKEEVKAPPVVEVDVVMLPERK